MGGGGGAWEEMEEVSERHRARESGKKQRNLNAIYVLRVTHVGVVEEIADGQQCGQDVAECPVFLQLVHPFL